MHPPAGAAAGGAMMNVRAVARANIILGLAMAAIAIVAATINPGDFQPQPQQCAATEAEALDLRKAALDLVFMGVVQAVFAAAADVAVAGSLPLLGRWLAVVAHIIGVFNAWSLSDLVNGVANVAIGLCAGGYLATGHVLVAMSYALLLAVSLAATLCW